MARQRDLTVIVVRGTMERTLNFRFPRFILPVLAVLFTASVAVAAISIHSWYQARQTNQSLSQEMQGKEQTIGQQQAAIRDLADKSRQAEPLLQQLQNMHKQLQDLLKANQGNLNQGQTSSAAALPAETAQAVAPLGEGAAPSLTASSDTYGARTSSRDIAIASRSAASFSRERDGVLDLAKVTLGQLDQQIQQAKELQALLAADQKQIENRLEYLAHVPTGSGVADYTVSSEFGWRVSPFGWGSDFHPGIDLAVDYGTPVYATADGRVEVAGYYTDWYGVTVMIDHGYGFETLYAHLQWKVSVHPGDHVKRGDLLGYIGLTGDTTGPHLHYEVRIDGEKVNPRPYLK